MNDPGMGRLPHLQEWVQKLSPRGSVQPLPHGPLHGAGDPGAPESPSSADVISGHEEEDFDPRQQLWRFLGGTHSAGPKLELWVEVALFSHF